MDYRTLLLLNPRTMIRIQRAIRRAARRSCSSRVHKIRTLASQATPAVEETHVTEVSSPKKTVAYPEIVSVTPRAIYRRQQEAYFDKIKKLGTVEEKLIALNLPKYYGWPSFILKENVVPYNYLPFAQFFTRTVISEVSWFQLAGDMTPHFWLSVL